MHYTYPVVPGIFKIHFSICANWHLKEYLFMKNSPQFSKNLVLKLLPYLLSIIMAMDKNQRKINTETDSHK